MKCCNNPNVKSSTYCDWCTNCGYEYDYVNCKSNKPLKEDEDIEDDPDFRY